MKIFVRKGQAAMEFMMTYGWAILVVLAAIGALSYFGILNPSKFTPDTCMGTSGVSCAGKPIITLGASPNNDSIWFTMINGMGYTVTPLPAPDGYEYSATLGPGGANCAAPSYCPIGNTTCGPIGGDGPSLTSIQDGGSVTVVIAGCNFNLVSVVKGEVKIRYKHPQSRLTETATISITGKTRDE